MVDEGAASKKWLNSGSILKIEEKNLLYVKQMACISQCPTRKDMAH